MAEVINDLSTFLNSFNEQNKHEVTFKIEDKDYTIVYGELTSGEEMKVVAEFERWYTDMYKGSDASKKDKDTNLQQYRYHKMISKHNMSPFTFDQFLSMPRMVISAMVSTIEEDLMRRYPHVRRQVELALGKIL